MGTEFLVKLANPPAGHDEKITRKRIDGILDEINRSMSTYLEDSELSRINRNPSTEWIAVSGDLWAVLKEADRISRLSQGAFDITIGPLVNLWGFGPRENSGDIIPDETKIKQVLESTGFRKIEFHPDERKIRKQLASVYMDLSAIAKGYAVDRIAVYLDSQGFENYMIEIGGEIRVRGRPTVDRGWRVGIEKPVAGRRAIQEILEIEDLGMATSGDYRNFIEVDGIRYSHTIDPLSGRPVRHELASVTVLHAAAMTADALATALNVLGPEAGARLASKENIPAYFIVRMDSGYREIYTHDFQKYVLKDTNK